MLALSVFYQSQKAYKQLSKLFALPSKRTLQKYMQNTNIMPGFNDGVFDALKLKVDNMDPKDRCVALIFDEMTLKSALVYNDGLDMIEGFEDLGESWNITLCGRPCFSVYGMRSLLKMETTSCLLPHSWYS